MAEASKSEGLEADDRLRSAAASVQSGPSDPEPDAPRTGMRRKMSFAQCDVLKYRKVFNAFDHTNDGRIKACHLGDVAAKLGYRLSEENIKEVLSNNNLDETSAMSFEQLLDILPSNTQQITMDQHRLAELRDKFQRYDLDGNGVISLNEAQWALQMELDVTPQTALRLLNQFVKLDYEQFVQFYGQVQKTKLTIYEQFGKYDKDLDGLISVEEAHSILHEELGFNKDRSQAMVQRFDVNKDGRVSYVEFAEFYIAVEERKSKIRESFRRYDRDEHGYVTVDDAEGILQNVLGFSEAKARNTIDNYDKNKEGKIYYEEFLEFYTMMEEERQRLLTEFGSFDLDGDGRICLREFSEILQSRGYKTEEIEALMAGYDADGDGFLDIDEFKRFLNFS